MEASHIKDLRDKVIQNIKEHDLIKTQRIIIGLSGGPDSVCLLHVMKQLSDTFCFELYPAHLNHMLRAEEADKDEEFCKELCCELGLTLKVWHMDIGRLAIESKKSIEETARDVRYSLFREYSSFLGGAMIAVAHNMDDQAETVLMRIIRGTGLDGLKGMEFYNDGIIRPLLSVPRSLIEEYNKAFNIVPRIDSTNLLTDYTRNKIRLELLPYIKDNFNSEVTAALFRLSQISKEDSSVLELYTEKEFTRCLTEKNQNTTVLSAGLLKNIPKSSLGRIIRRAVSDYIPDLKGIEQVHIDQVKKLVYNGRTGSTIQLPGSLRAYRDYESIKLYREGTVFINSNIDYSVAIDKPGKYVLKDNKEVTVEFLSYYKYKEEKIKCSQNSLVQYFDFEGHKSPICLRGRQAGDIIYPYGSKGSKKLKEFLIDQKIPREKRDGLLLLADGNEIIWVVGLRTSDKYKVNIKSAEVVKIEVKL